MSVEKVNIGIDFGSTNSAFAYYDKKSKEVKNFSLTTNKAPSIPSIVTVSSRTNNWLYGNTAKTMVGKNGQRVFEHFKMLLAEKSDEIIRSRGYDDDAYTPRNISRFFLHSVLKKIQDINDIQVQDVVICTPENWGKKTGKYMDGRGLLKEILSTDMEGNPIDRKVRVVTEPEAASAYFAYNYEKLTEKAFNGHLLLIDYGGGTLDLTLTRVESNGDGMMNISYVDGGGAGENHEDGRMNTIGNAGVAYIQDVILSAMNAQGLLDDNQAVDYSAPDFKAAVVELESKLIDMSPDIYDRFVEYGGYKNIADILDEDPEDDYFTDISYGDGLDITYAMLFASYQKIVEDVLKNEIEKINSTILAKIHRDPCAIGGAGEENFKIALVGGFGNFALVQMQINELYNINADTVHDGRMTHIDGTTKELAVSLGAALIAGGRVDLKRVARYSIGMKVSRGLDPITGKEREAVRYGIHIGECLEPGEIGYCRYNGFSRDNANGRVLFMNVIAQDVLVINKTGKPCDHVKMPMRQSMILKIRQMLEPFNPDQPRNWNIGFSIDDSGIIVFHATDSDDPAVTIEIPLARFSELFEANIDARENRIIEEE